MKQIKKFFSQIRDYFVNLPFKTYVTLLLEGMGLFANLIAIASFFGAVNTPKESSNFYINNQEFLVWSLIALFYTLGLLSARFKRRWRRKIEGAGIEDTPFDSSDFGYPFIRSALHWEILVRDFCFTLASTFPLIYLYIKALDAAYTKGTASPWVSLGETASFCIPITFGIMIASSIFDKALSLYAGD